MLQNPDRVLQLLTIVEKVAGAAPGLTHISGEAMAELREIHERLRKTKLAEQNKPVTPAPYGDKDSPPPSGMSSENQDNPALAKHPTASTPVQAPVGGNPQQPQPQPPSSPRPTRNVVGGLPGPAEPEEPVTSPMPLTIKPQEPNNG